MVDPDSKVGHRPVLKCTSFLIYHRVLSAKPGFYCESWTSHPHHWDRNSHIISVNIVYISFIRLLSRILTQQLEGDESRVKINQTHCGLLSALVQEWTVAAQRRIRPNLCVSYFCILKICKSLVLNVSNLSVKI